MNLLKFMSASIQKVVSTSRHVHNGIELLLVIKGSIEVVSKEELITLHKNDVLLIQHNKLHHLSSDDDNLVILLHLEHEFLEEYCSEILTGRYMVNSTTSIEPGEYRFNFLRQFLAHIMEIYYNQESGYELQIMAKVFRLLNHIIKYFQTSELPKITSCSDPDDRIERILSYMATNYTDNLTLTDIAKQEYLSVHYLSKLFKEKTGTNFHEHLISLRIGKAKRLLLGSNLSISRVGLDSGFPNAQSFNREFQKIFHEKPSVFRARNQSKIKRGIALMEETGSDEKNNYSDLLNYVVSNSFEDRENEMVVPTVNLDFSDLSEEERRPLDHVVKVGRFRELMDTTTRFQLEETARPFGFRYIHIQDFFKVDTMAQVDSVFFGYRDTLHNIEYIRSLSLIPIIQIDIDDFSSEIASGNCEAIEERLLRPMRLVLRNFGAEYLATWRFEVIGEELLEHFEVFEWILRTLSAFTNQFGIAIAENLTRIEADRSLLERMGEKDIKLSFITFLSDPNRLTGNYSKELLKNYLTNQICQLRNLLQDYGYKDVKKFITFNTLLGPKIEYAGRFFRAGLILEEIMMTLKEPDVHLCYWISINNHRNAVKGSIEFNIMSLYNVGMVKRPVCFVLEFIAQAKARLSSPESGFLIGANKEAYYLLVYDQYYYNPQFSIKENYLSTKIRNISAHVKGLEPGHYLVKKFVLDKDHGGNFEMILNLIEINQGDLETLKYVERMNGPLMSLSKEKIHDVFHISTDITSNAVLFYKIEKLAKMNN